MIALIFASIFAPHYPFYYPWVETLSLSGPIGYYP